MWADLHMHSTYSDGVFTPAELMEQIVKAGITVFSLTDHDTLKGLGEMAGLAKKNGLDFIPGVELSTQMEGHQVHVLGYGIRQDDAVLASRLAQIRAARRIRLEEIREKLRQLGIDVKVPVPPEGTRAVGRPHVARALAEQGFVTSVEEAFELYIGEGKPAYVPQPKLIPAEALKLIHQAGGLAVIAHPEEIKSRELASRLLRTLPFDGLEIFHPSVRTNALHEYWLTLARKLNLKITGGSDFHGLTDRFPGSLGEWRIKRDIVQDFLAEFGF